MNWTIVRARQEFSPSAIRLHLQDKQNKVLNKSRAQQPVHMEALCKPPEKFTRKWGNKVKM